MIGDVIFFKKNDKSIISSMISKITKSEYTHVGIILANSEDLDSFVIIESDRFITTKLSTISKKDNKYTIYTISEIDSDTRFRISENSYKHLGKKYDYRQIFKIALSIIFKIDRDRFFNNYNRLICSELVDIVYFKSGVKRKSYDNIGNITPGELLEYYDFLERG